MGNSEINNYNAENTNILGFQRTNQTNNQTNNEALHNLEGNDGTESTNLQNQSLAGSWGIWTEIYGSRSNNGDAKSSLWAGYVGMHYFVSDQNIIGLIGQFDWSDQTDSSNGSKVDGRGWMIGPYIAGKFEDQTLYYEASIRYGRSENNISPIGTFTDKFETERLMLSRKLTGEYKHDTVTVRPEIGLTWYKESQKSYTDSLNHKIPEQVISTGEFRFGPVFSKQVKLDNGNIITPNFGISGVYNFDVRNNNTSKGTSTNTDELRARFTVGVKTTNAMGWSLSAASFYDGVGIDDYYSYGGSIKLTVPLN
ncbi:MAG: autotransporter outer membrane beta-barrel domain-containing protein [Rhizobiales bacterium]|nr:autotransporter outer membrane beta-barrel domain-containing protein [Hyphomicrobiales bacterium]